MTTEFELKFQVPVQRSAAVEADVARGRSRQTRLLAHYFDTPDGALARERIVLRVRREGDAWVQTAKAPGASLLERHEHNVTLPQAADDRQPLPDLSRHHGTEVGRLLAKALRRAGHATDGEALRPTYRMDVLRRSRVMRAGDAVVELAFDQGTLVAGTRERPICELEIELKEGDARSLLELARRWRKRHGLWLDTVPKSARGEQLTRGVAHGDAVRAKAPRLARRIDGPAMFRVALAGCSAQVIGNASEIAAGSPDPEHVHQLRVGIRRLRTLLRELGELAPWAPDEAWNAALVACFRALGAQRDRAALTAEWQPRIEAAGGPAVSWPASAAAPEPGEVVRSAAFQAILLDLLEASLPPAATAPIGADKNGDEDGNPSDDAHLAGRVEMEGNGDGHGADHDGNAVPRGKALRAWVAERLATLHRQVVRGGKDFDGLDAHARHRVRKRLKRLRYLADMTAGLFGDKAVERYVRRLAPAQDALGLYNDATMAAQAYRAAQAEDGDAGFALGWLAAHEPERAAACRKALRKIDGAPRYWRGKA